MVKGKWLVDSAGRYPYCSVCLNPSPISIPPKHCLCGSDNDPPSHLTLDEEITKREAILLDAIQTICNDRQDLYGEPEDNFSRLAEALNVVLDHKLIDKLTAYDVAMILVTLKLIRSSGGNIYKRDNLVDLAGYAACAAETRDENGE